jgi:hypothetical protein
MLADSCEFDRTFNRMVLNEETGFHPTSSCLHTRRLGSWGLFFKTFYDISSFGCHLKFGHV